MTKHYCDKCGGEAGSLNRFETEIDVPESRKITIKLEAANSFEHVCRDCMIRAWAALLSPAKRKQKSKKTKKTKKKTK